MGNNEGLSLLKDSPNPPMPQHLFPNIFSSLLPSLDAHLPITLPLLFLAFPLHFALLTSSASFPLPPFFAGGEKI